MKTFSPLVREHFEPKQTLCQMIITMDISTVESVTSPSRRLILRLILFNDASLFSLLLSVLISGTERSPPPAAAETSPVLSECAGKENFVWQLFRASAALFCPLCGLASFLRVNAFLFCYPFGDSSAKPPN